MAQRRYIMKKTEDSRSYQELKMALDEILIKLQNEDADIDEAMKLHAEGQKILSLLDSYLSKIAGKTEININKLG